MKEALPEKEYLESLLSKSKEELVRIIADFRSMEVELSTEIDFLNEGIVRPHFVDKETFQRLINNN